MLGPKRSTSIRNPSTRLEYAKELISILENAINGIGHLMYRYGRNEKNLGEILCCRGFPRIEDLYFTKKNCNNIFSDILPDKDVFIEAVDSNFHKRFKLATIYKIIEDSDILSIKINIVRNITTINTRCIHCCVDTDYAFYGPEGKTSLGEPIHIKCRGCKDDSDLVYGNKSKLKPVRLSMEQLDAKLIPTFTGKCDNSHLSTIRGVAWDRNLQRRRIQCPICAILPKFEIFKVIMELDMFVTIEETFSDSIKGNKDIKLLSRLEILVYNKLDHVIGKIVFDDYNGEKQAKSNRNNVEFIWLETRFVNDREYCISTLNVFHKRIVSRYNMK